MGVQTQVCPRAGSTEPRVAGRVPRPQLAEWATGPAASWALARLQAGGDTKALVRAGEDPALSLPSPCVTLGESCPVINLNNHPPPPTGLGRCGM